MSLITAQKRRIRRLNLTRRLMQAGLWAGAYAMLLMTACFLLERLPLWATVELMTVATVIEGMVTGFAIEFINHIYRKELETENLELRRLADRHNRLTGGWE